MRNIEILKEFATTKYADFKGIISIDSMDKLKMTDLCRENGIDMDKYYLLAFGLMGEDILGIGRRDSVTCRVLLLDKSIYGSTGEERIGNIKKEEKVTAIKKSFHIKYADLQQYIKRFNFMAATEMIDYIKEIDIQED